jgi:HlyD family secretion protein
MKTKISILLGLFYVAACSPGDSEYDATGTFEADETIISAQASGVLNDFVVDDGESLQAGQVVGYIDSTQLHLKRKQMEAQIQAVLSKRPNISAQLAALYEQLKQAKREHQRVANLVQADAATKKQLDDAASQVAVVERQIDAQESSLGITTGSLREEALPLRVQIEQLNDQIAKCRVVNPIPGTVLTSYAESFEVVQQGKPLYKIADVSELKLRAYITGNQLAQVKLNQNVTVMVDDGKDGYRKYDGRIEWVSDKAEFTPKTIQTKDERANLVYAMRVRVKNDGYLKIGMYGEIKF